MKKLENMGIKRDYPETKIQVIRSYLDLPILAHIKNRILQTQRA